MGKNNYNYAWRAIWLVCLLTFGTSLYATDYRPFIQANPTSEKSAADAAKSLIPKLTEVGFEVVGQYSPFKGAEIIGVTSKELKRACSRGKFGGFAGVMHVAATDTASGVEISYTNPSYIGYAYSIGALDKITDKLATALGNRGEFGSKDGIPQEDLGNWHYMFGMPYFDDAVVVGEFDNHAAAVAAVERGLANTSSDMSQIWKVSIDSKQTLFGVRLHRGYWANNKIEEIMAMLDTGGRKHTASLPWEILVHDNEVVYLPGKYRIALVFPDLSMGSFMHISDVPEEMDKSAEKLISLSK